MKHNSVTNSMYEPQYFQTKYFKYGLIDLKIHVHVFFCNDGNLSRLHWQLVYTYYILCMYMTNN